MADHQGSIIAENGAATTRYAYGPYGEPDTWTGSRFRYTGQIALPEIQLYHYKARVYDPVLGRFLQTDPVGYEDDLNLYAYVRNDPLNLSDPTGMESASFAVGDYDPLNMTPEERARYDQQASALGNVVLDLLPGIGDVKGGLEFLQNPSWGGGAAIVVGLLPGGDLGRGAVREGVDDVVDVVVDSARHPEAARHIDDAQAAGHPSVLTIDRPGADARREAATSGQPTSPGMDRDEYPPAFTAEGGAGASVRSIPAGDNRGAGACIGNQCRTLPDGTRIRIITKQLENSLKGDVDDHDADQPADFDLVFPTMRVRSPIGGAL